MATKVADVRSNLNENILFAARIIGRSTDRRKVFEAIYFGKKEIKTVDEIASASGLARKRVLEEGKKLSANHVAEQTTKDGQVAYRKDETFTHHKKTILSILDSPKKASKMPTKQRPAMAAHSYNIYIANKTPKIKSLTIDDIDSFKNVKKFPSVDESIKLNNIAESKIKEGLKRIIGETHEHKDWGGEKNDLYTNKLLYKNKRRIAAFALKGKATKGTLTPNKMGKNGDQIIRLVKSAAEIFFVVYHGKIDESITAQLEAFSLGKALSGKQMFFGTIDGDDLNRLYQAYKDKFK